MITPVRLIFRTRGMLQTEIGIFNGFCAKTVRNMPVLKCNELGNCYWSYPPISSRPGDDLNDHENHEDRHKDVKVCVFMIYNIRYKTSPMTHPTGHDSTHLWKQYPLCDDNSFPIAWTIEGHQGFLQGLPGRLFGGSFGMRSNALRTSFSLSV